MKINVEFNFGIFLNARFTSLAGQHPSEMVYMARTTFQAKIGSASMKVVQLYLNMKRPDTEHGHTTGT